MLKRLSIQLEKCTYGGIRTRDLKITSHTHFPATKAYSFRFRQILINFDKLFSSCVCQSATADMFTHILSTCILRKRLKQIDRRNDHKGILMPKNYSNI